MTILVKVKFAFTGILLPSNAPKEYADRCILWNSVERAERAKNAQLAIEMEVSIPGEIPKSQWVKMMEEYCKSNFVDNGIFCCIVYHKDYFSNFEKQKIRNMP